MGLIQKAVGQQTCQYILKVEEEVCHLVVWKKIRNIAEFQHMHESSIEALIADIQYVPYSPPSLFFCIMPSEL